MYKQTKIKPFYFKRYEQFNCVQLCFQKYLFETCSCYDITLPKANHLYEYYASKACKNVTQFKCLNQVKLDFYFNESLVGECYNKCPMECSKVFKLLYLI